MFVFFGEAKKIKIRMIGRLAEMETRRDAKDFGRF